MNRVCDQVETCLRAKGVDLESLVEPSVSCPLCETRSFNRSGLMSHMKYKHAMDTREVRQCMVQHGIEKKSVEETSSPYCDEITMKRDCSPGAVKQLGRESSPGLEAVKQAMEGPSCDVERIERRSVRHNASRGGKRSVTLSRPAVQFNGERSLDHRARHPANYEKDSSLPNHTPGSTRSSPLSDSPAVQTNGVVPTSPSTVLASDSNEPVPEATNHTVLSCDESSQSSNREAKVVDRLAGCVAPLGKLCAVRPSASIMVPCDQ